MFSFDMFEYKYFHLTAIIFGIRINDSVIAVNYDPLNIKLKPVWLTYVCSIVLLGLIWFKHV